MVERLQVVWVVTNARVVRVPRLVEVLRTQPLQVPQPDRACRGEGRSGRVRERGTKAAELNRSLECVPDRPLLTKVLVSDARRSRGKTRKGNGRLYTARGQPTYQPWGGGPRTPRHWCSSLGTWCRCDQACRAGTGDARRSLCFLLLCSQVARSTRYPVHQRMPRFKTGWRLWRHSSYQPSCPRHDLILLFLKTLADSGLHPHPRRPG